MALGTPQYGNQETVYHKNWKLKAPDTSKGETLFVLPDIRILPPMHSLDNKGIWAKYHGQHFGYAGNAKEPGKVRQRPFACIQQTDFRTKMVTVPCNACDVIDEKSAERKAREAEYKAAGKSDQETRELLEPLTAWLKKHNCDRKWHINVVNRAGEFGVLQISHTLKKALDVKIEEVRKRKIDPIAVDGGVWFRFSRMGKFPVQDSVEFVLTGDDENGWKIEKAPLTEAQCEQAEKVCPDLASGVVKPVSASQIAQLVSCSGDPDEVDRIWQQGTKTAEHSPMRPVVAPKAQPVVIKPSVEQTEVEKLKAQLMALTSGVPLMSQVPVTEQKTPTALVPSSVNEDETEMSDEEFYEKFNGKK